MTTNYYLYHEWFPKIEYLPKDGELPKDIKFLVSRNNDSFVKGAYFVSAETKSVYKLGYKSYFELSQTPCSKRSHKVNVITDEDKRTTITLSDRFFKDIKDMNELKLINHNPNGGRRKCNNELNIYAETPCVGDE